MKGFTEELGIVSFGGAGEPQKVIGRVNIGAKFGLQGRSL